MTKADFINEKNSLSRSWYMGKTCFAGSIRRAVKSLATCASEFGCGIWTGWPASMVGNGVSCGAELATHEDKLCELAG